MYLLYLDESGNERGADDRYFLLAGLAVHESYAAALSSALDALQEEHFPGHPPIVFHATDMRAGKNFWRRVKPEKRDEVLAGVGKIIADTPTSSVALFGAVIEKTNELHSDPAVKRATAECCGRFDVFLKRRSAAFEPESAGAARRDEHGLMLFAEGRFDQRARVWVSDFRRIGTEAGVIERLSDIPFFVPMKESRLLQLADYVAHALFLLYERHDPSLARAIVARMDTEDGILHGLKHVRRTTPGGADCGCPACHSRQVPGEFGRWVAEQATNAHASEAEVKSEGSSAGGSPAVPGIA